MSRGDRESGGLDALFGAVEEPAAVDEAPVEEERRRSPVGLIIRDVLVIAAAVLVIKAALNVAGIGVPLAVIIAALVALRLIMWAVGQVAPPPVPVPQVRHGEEPGDYRWVGSDSLRAAVRTWEYRLDWSQADPERFTHIVLPVLAEVTDERLRLRHGFTRASDPRRARELLGEPMWLLLAEPGRRPPRPRDVAGYVEILERL